MSAPQKQTLLVGNPSDGDDHPREIAYRQRAASRPDVAGLFWMNGYKSNMEGDKALALDGWAADKGAACTRFDYSGHGISGGDFLDGTISRWLEESLAIFDQKTEGPQIVCGSSMGGWLALLLTRAHIARVGIEQSRIKGLVLIAPAIDMTKALMWDNFDDAAKAELAATGIFLRPSDYDDDPYQITARLIEDGKAHLLGDAMIETGCPLHILQGVQDDTVPWQSSVDLVARLARDDVKLTLVKDGDHRLSRPQDLDLLIRAVESLLGY
nr:alpha/beta fold hydrolase [uncultured Cohaesibacter sp.]